MQVNVTFYPSGNCLRETKSYVAFSNSALSPNFTDQTTPNNANTCGSTLLMNTDRNGSVVTLLAPWINTTIIIRRYAELLAVTLQVPGHLSFESDGLCRGCPAHTFFNVSRFDHEVLVSSNCRDESNNAVFNCYVILANQFSEVINITYTEMCKYSLFRSNSSSFDVLSFLKAVSEDAKLLGSYGNVPRRQFDIVELGDSSEAGIVNESCDPPGSNDTADPVDTTDHTSTVATEPKGSTITQSSSTQPASTTTDLGLGIDEISSAIHAHERQAMASLFAAGLLAVLTCRLLTR